MAVSIVSFSITGHDDNVVNEFKKFISEYNNVNLEHNTYYIKHNESCDDLYIKLRSAFRELNSSEYLDLYITPLNYVIFGIQCLKVKDWLEANYDFDKITYANEDN